MNKIQVLCLTMAFSLAALAGCQPAAQPAEKQSASAPAEITKDSLKTPNDKLNYVQGLDVGRSIKRGGMVYQSEIFQKGLLDGMNEAEDLLVSDEDQAEIKREHMRQMMDQRRKEREELAEKNKTEGEQFLAKNKAREGVTTTESGLQYEVITAADGPKPTLKDKVKVHYVGTLIDGTEFDSSVKRGEPSTFNIDRVVAGWTEALQLMPVGAKWKLYIPSELGYGTRGAGRQIGANAVLIFEVELLSIEPDSAGPQ
ncbi:MAG: FKBP-type peptidyl-prolyl cis-trans isomerase [Proteobacteria bacterium]|nr:FKBP-type peptidyl-prolyl cis-trans isomerase [Pseudomonadota bacterium]